MLDESPDPPIDPRSTARGSGPPTRRRWIRWLARLGLLYVLWCAALYAMQGSMLFPAEYAPHPTPKLYNDRTVELRLELADGGEVVAWFIPAPRASDNAPAPAVVFFHGNAEIIDYQVEVIERYRALGCSVMLPEYRGYGRSAGQPSEEALVADAVRFYDLLAARSDVDPARIAFHGRSVGGGVAAGLAARRKPAALILESCFTSAASMARRYGVPAFLVKNPFRIDRVLSTLEVPVFIAHGSADDIIPVSHGRALRALAPSATYVEYDCGHNDFPGRANVEHYWTELARFLRRSRVISE